MHLHAFDFSDLCALKCNAAGAQNLASTKGKKMESRFKKRAKPGRMEWR